MTDEPRPRFRLRWWHIAIATLLVLATFFMIWFQSDGDLVAIDARATAMGVPTTWEKLGLKQSPPDVRRDWQRLHQLAEAVKSYDEWPLMKPGVPVPAELIQHHAAQSAADISEIHKLCNQLQPNSVTIYTSYSFDTDLPNITRGRSLTRWYAERMSLIPPDQVADEANASLAAIVAEHPRLLLSQLVTVSRLSIWSQGIIRRLHDPGIDRETLANQADRARAWLESVTRSAWEGEFLTVKALSISSHKGKPVFSSSVVMPSLIDRFFSRAGREAILTFDLDMIEAWTSNTTARDRITAMSRLEDAVNKRVMNSWDPRNRLLGMLAPACSMVCLNWATADTTLRVLAAELRGTPWPIDPTDPSGATVRKVMRNGKLIGFYLLKDGVDDDGVKGKDDCVPLYEPLGKPKASDPWQTPATP
ncbi:MAG: hypothetical protein AAB263_01460 [Planctomycetota bacterium]